MAFVPEAINSSARRWSGRGIVQRAGIDELAFNRRAGYFALPRHYLAICSSCSGAPFPFQPRRSPASRRRSGSNLPLRITCDAADDG